ncbi:MAG TPA: MAPEG family protein [Steroidobacteraceae bacterium]|nr:MAPEG family protein [Steroidobacteraceae bacterium]
MTTAFWCVLAAGLLPFVATMIAKSKPGFDNRNPRAWLQSQEGFRQRANAAQMNSFESFPLFAAAVIIAYVLQAPQGTIDQLALGFVAARVAYIICYVADWATVRSLCWAVGIGCTVAIFIIAA